MKRKFLLPVLPVIAIFLLAGCSPAETSYTLSAGVLEVNLSGAAVQNGSWLVVAVFEEGESYPADTPVAINSCVIASGEAALNVMEADGSGEPEALVWEGDAGGNYDCYAYIDVTTLNYTPATGDFDHNDNTTSMTVNGDMRWDVSFADFTVIP